ncbi:hypothetical protein [Tsukamurella soli]|uniref:Uncharacterized protein n=1 Tax=Tsukamurella soli TaxID=644556 RepID=A0ABP8J6I7_9ACTN
MASVNTTDSCTFTLGGLTFTLPSAPIVVCTGRAADAQRGLIEQLRQSLHAAGVDHYRWGSRDIDQMTDLVFGRRALLADLALRSVADPLVVIGNAGSSGFARWHGLGVAAAELRTQLILLSDIETVALHIRTGTVSRAIALEDDARRLAHRLHLDAPPRIGTAAGLYVQRDAGGGLRTQRMTVPQDRPCRERR